MVINRLMRITAEDGVRGVARAGYMYALHTVDQSGLYTPPYHKRKRVDSAERWQLIHGHIDTGVQSMLDIGCATGFFTQRAGDAGYCALGIERRAERVAKARRLASGQPNTAFMQRTITPETIESLPAFDRVLLLAVYHHGCGAFGSDEAAAMLRELASVSHELFIEPPDEMEKKFPLIADLKKPADQPIEEYYLRVFDNKFNGCVDIDFLGCTQYSPGSRRHDPIFKLDCRAY